MTTNAPPDPRDTPDARLGMAWWNGLTPAERLRWLNEAGNTGVAADAWEAFKRSQVQM